MMIARIALLFLICTVANCDTLNGTLTFTSYTTSDCSGNHVATVTIPTEVCINNHDFNKVSCEILTDCLSGGTISYETLVNCTQAPAMKLSIKVEAHSSTSLVVYSYALSKTCFGVPVPIFETVGDCSTFFAFNKDCYPSGIIGFESDNLDQTQQRKERNLQ